MPGDQLDRDDLIRGINAVIAKLRAAGQPAGIRIVGGAALALRYFDRRTTADVDAHLQPEQPILKAAVEVADENGWPQDWLNSKATMFLPSYGADPGWEVLYANEDITVEVASPRALLAMKLNASRPGRDVQDIANLLAICDVRELSAAEELLNDFFPGDGLPDKALRLLEPIFKQGIPAVPASPPPPLLGTRTSHRAPQQQPGPAE
ncbi:hypothetical protein E3T28_14140 [Cryobacterium sinapicolor]|uniref:DUF6036 domain-containing protein n=1 Tax=Cryobacterium sinapicolor TaxID=1259236 RepID=A0ABY2IWZ2_9MICO|nr:MULTISPECIES: DUF6036 family nucleotidyltransferase [Cryobacterium]TFC84267.1 hypothetical protein E3O67_13720 [Cryobacterium sp. TMT3-29-2]TFC95076.1 hypothetical protein E3T28_14140 [Cryobacterium sinapicolor]